MILWFYESPLPSCQTRRMSYGHHRAAQRKRGQRQRPPLCRPLGQRSIPQHSWKQRSGCVTQTTLPNSFWPFDELQYASKAIMAAAPNYLSEMVACWGINTAVLHNSSMKNTTQSQTSWDLLHSSSDFRWILHSDRARQRMHSRRRAVHSVTPNFQGEPFSRADCILPGTCTEWWILKWQTANTLTEPLAWAASTHWAQRGWHSLPCTF